MDDVKRIRIFDLFKRGNKQKDYWKSKSQKLFHGVIHVLAIMAAENTILEVTMHPNALVAMMRNT